tara:strand:- start:205 stop:1140 length:936 start_codon:yes stop_codon:yes gene_type:complete
LKILIYGGSGYLGSSIANSLKKNCEISIISRNKIKKKIIDNIVWLNKKKNSKQINTSIKKANIILISNGPTQDRSQKELFEYSKYFFNEIDRIKKYKHKKSKIIFLSSIHVYENKNKKKIEVYDNLYSQSYYGIQNILCENIILNKFRSNLDKIKIIRISNIFGVINNSKINYENNMLKLAINQFCLKTVKQEKIYIKSNKSQKRNYVSINDFIKFVKFLIYENKKLPTIINYSSNGMVSLKNIMKAIINESKKLGIREPKFILKNKIKNSKINYSTNNKLLSVLNMEPNIKFNEEILNTLNQFNNFYKNV